MYTVLETRPNQQRQPAQRKFLTALGVFLICPALLTCDFPPRPDPDFINVPTRYLPTSRSQIFIDQSQPDLGSGKILIVFNPGSFNNRPYQVIQSTPDSPVQIYCQFVNTRGALIGTCTDRLPGSKTNFTLLRKTIVPLDPSRPHSLKLAWKGGKTYQASWDNQPIELNALNR